METKPMLVAVDDGFAYTKAAVFDKEKKVIRTWSEPTYIASGIQGITSFSGTDAVQVYEVDGVYFTVGNMMTQEDTRYDDYPFSPQNAAMVHHVLYAGHYVPEGAHVHVAASVPMAMFYDAEHRDEIVARRQKSLMRPVYRQGAAQNFVIDKVDILPEAASSYIDFVLSDDGVQTSDVLPQVAIIDIGGRTTDIAVMLEGMLIDKARSGTEQIGVLDLLNDIVLTVQGSVAKQLGKPAPVKIPVRLAENILLTFNQKKEATVNLFGRRFDVTEEVSKCVESFVRNVYANAQRRIENISAQMDKVAITGGGAVLTESVFRDVYPHVFVPNQPQYSNVRGMLKYMMYLNRENPEVVAR